MAITEAELVAFDDVYCAEESHGALKVLIEGEEVRIPKSQVHDDSEVWKFKDEGRLVIPLWLAQNEGLT